MLQSSGGFCPVFNRGEVGKQFELVVEGRLGVEPHLVENFKDGEVAVF